jgi:N-acetylglutamate synthase/N-acetylornithine aminotransferase
MQLKISRVVRNSATANAPTGNAGAGAWRGTGASGCVGSMILFMLDHLV